MNVHQPNASPSGPGIVLNTNQQQTYAFYNNFWNGNGTAGPNFDHPEPTGGVKADDPTFFSLAETFKGRVQRGTQLLATWVEFRVAAFDGAAHGDIGLEQGCDGVATVNATNESGQSNGSTDEVLSAAPEPAVQYKPDGTKALATTMGNWMSGPNEATVDYLNQVVS